MYNFFEKNVNKQLKSADFLSEMSKFQKNYLNKVFAFLILMLDHTLVFVVQPPKSQKPRTCTHVLLFTLYPYEKICNGNFLIFCQTSVIFKVYEIKFQINLTTKRKS